MAEMGQEPRSRQSLREINGGRRKSDRLLLKHPARLKSQRISGPLAELRSPLPRRRLRCIRFTGKRQPAKAQSARRFRREEIEDQRRQGAARAAVKYIQFGARPVRQIKS
jgi:hypothetical protein